MTKAIDTIAEAAIEDIERRGRSLSKADWYALLDTIIDQLVERKDAAADDLRAEGVDVREIEE